MSLIYFLIILFLAYPAANSFADWLVYRPDRKFVKPLKRGQVFVGRDGDRWKIVGVCKSRLTVALKLESIRYNGKSVDASGDGFLLVLPSYISDYMMRVE